MQFSYDLVIETSAGVPRALPIDPRKYSDLLAENLRRSIDAVEKLIGDKPQRVLRIGAVLTSQLDMEEELPPGLKYLIDHFGAPWSHTGGLVKSRSEMLMQLGECQGSVDRCFHNLTFDLTGDDKGLVFKLDWQRYYKSGLDLSSDQAKSCLTEVINLASSYFSRAGEGNYG